MPLNSFLRASGALALLSAGALASACTTDAKGSSPQSSGTDKGVVQSGETKPGAGANGGSSRAAPSMTLAETDVATIAPSMIEAGTALTGDLRPIETIDVRARLEGELTTVSVREGQQVSAGQVLARFESTEQESSQKSAEADRAAAKADLANAEWTYEQDASLYKAGAIAQRDFKNAEQAVAAARARLAAAEARLSSSANQARDTRVIAPSAGIVDKKMVENGEHVAKGAALFTIVRNGTLELAAAVPARNAGAVRVGQTVHLVADARRFDGRVARVSPTIDPASRSITVYVEIPNPGGVIRGGTFATGRVVNQTLNNVLAVPTSALRQTADSGKPFVYRIDGKTVNVANVQLGAIDERQGVAQVIEGLQAGDRVIVGNVGTIGRGMQVTIAGEEKGGKHGKR
jgi:RND family efflux transporter MFP subunit